MKRWKPIFVVIAVVALIGGVIYGPRAWTVWRFSGVPHVPSVDSDFTNLGHILPSPGAGIARLHLGLAHNFQDKETFKEEVWHSPTFSLHGYRFHEEQWTADAAFRLTAARLLTDSKTFTAYAGPMMCGGYHADFAACLDAPGSPCWFLVCLGCEEVIIFHGNEELICDLDPHAWRELLEAFRAAGGRK